MDKRWKVLTEPLWEELSHWHFRREGRVAKWTNDKMPLVTLSWTGVHPGKRPKPKPVKNILLKLVAIRRARLEGQDPVYWALQNK